MADLIRPIERHLKRHLTTEVGRRRFDRAKRFVDEAALGGDAETVHRVNARWFKFLCSRAPVQTGSGGGRSAQLATVFGLPPAEARKFIGLSLFGPHWRALCFADLWKAPELVARLTRVIGWEHFDRCRQKGAGLILLPVHGLFAPLFRLYLSHRGHFGLEVGLPGTSSREGIPRQRRAVRACAAMHTAKRLLGRRPCIQSSRCLRNLDHSARGILRAAAPDRRRVRRARADRRALSRSRTDLRRADPSS